MTLSDAFWNFKEVVRSAVQVAWSFSLFDLTFGTYSAKSVTGEWINDILALSTPGAKLVDVREIGGHSGTTDRRRFTLEWNDAGRNAGHPEHVFIKSTALTRSSRYMGAVGGMLEREVRFFNTAARELRGRIEIPNTYYQRASGGGRFMIVMEDLVKRGAETYALADECPLVHAQAMMKTLGGLHAAYWNSPRLSGEFRWVTRYTRRYGYPKRMMWMKNMRTHYLEHRDQFPEFSDNAARMAECLNKYQGEVSRFWESGHQTFLHGDSHFGNTYHVDGRAGLLDWQCIIRGPGIREPAYFIGGGLSIEMRRRHERDLLKIYLETLSENGVNAWSEEEAWDMYRFFLYDAWDAANLTYLWAGLQNPENMKQGYLRTNAAVQDHEVDKVVRRMIERRS